MYKTIRNYIFNQEGSESIEKVMMFVIGIVLGLAVCNLLVNNANQWLQFLSE